MKPEAEAKAVQEAVKASREAEKKNSQSYKTKPAQVTTVICGNDVLYCGTGVASVVLEKVG